MQLSLQTKKNNHISYNILSLWFTTKEIYMDDTFTILYFF